MKKIKHNIKDRENRLNESLLKDFNEFKNRITRKRLQFHEVAKMSSRCSLSLLLHMATYQFLLKNGKDHVQKEEFLKECTDLLSFVYDLLSLEGLVDSSQKNQN